MDKNISTAKKTALSGILLALTVIILFFASIVPTSRLALYALSSFMVAIVITEFNIKAGWSFYSVSCLMTLLVPNKLVLVPYVLFFGLYGIIKFYIERIDRLFPEYILKLVFFNVFIYLSFILVKEIFLPDISISKTFNNFPLWIIIVVIEIAFILYDYVYTLFIQYYNEKLKKILRL